MPEFKRYLVTSALPYANGPLHIGHIAGAYLPADIYVRYLRLKNEDVVFICGSDEHGVPITLRARKEGVHPQEVVDKFHKINKKAFEDLGIAFNIYHRTSDEIHHQTAADFFKKLYNKGELVEKEEEQFFDEEAEQYLADRYITGTCPKCGFENAYGDQCEKCGSSLSPNELINPRSALSGNKPVLRKTKHWYLPLDKYQREFLEEWIYSHQKDWKANVFGQCKSWLDQGLQPRAVTRDLKWGVPVPLPEASDKVLYVWFDAPIGYISATKAWAEETGNDWKKYWQDEETKLVHFIGKDNIVFHCLIFPAMLKVHGDFVMPDNVPANEFLNLESNKLSTSRNWAVWVHEYLTDFPGKQDALRYTLCANFPEQKDNNFSWKDFQDKNNNELLAILGNFVNRALVLTSKYYNGQVPEPEPFNDFDKAVIEEMAGYKDKVEKAIENFKFREALKEAMNLARLGNKYLADTEPWKIYKTDEPRVRTILYLALQMTANLSAILEPFVPFTAEKLRNFLNIARINWNKISSHQNLPVGHQVKKPEHLFDKIEDEAIDAQVKKLGSSEKEEEKDLPEPPKESINYDDFNKLDIRVATVLEAEKVPKTDKLMKLTVDTGIDQRTVVAGIAKFFKPGEVKGRKVCILVNLEPRKLKGIKSQGMVLMAENPEGTLDFVNPGEHAVNGAIIR